jgi:Uma2 family endonuclease
MKTPNSFGLKRQPFRVFVADQRVWIPENNVYFYPDVIVVPAEIELQLGRRDTIMNPVVVAEVLSESTQVRDRTTKFSSYRKILSFSEYLLIAQDRIYVEHFRKEKIQERDFWVYQSYDKLELVVNLSSVPVKFTLADLYDKVDFDLA